MSFEALAAAQAAATGIDCPLVAAVVGSGVGQLAAEVANKRVTEVATIDSPELAQYSLTVSPRHCAKRSNRSSPPGPLPAHLPSARPSPQARRVARGCFVSDGVDMRFDGDEANLRQAIVPRQASRRRVRIRQAAALPVRTVGRVPSRRRGRGGDAAPFRNLPVSLDASTMRTQAEPPYQDAKDAVDLGSAQIIVSVGRGIQDPDNIPQAELWPRRSGRVAASRSICDNGWLPLDARSAARGRLSLRISTLPWAFPGRSSTWSA